MRTTDASASRDAAAAEARAGEARAGGEGELRAGGGGEAGEVPSCGRSRMSSVSSVASSCSNHIPNPNPDPEPNPNPDPNPNPNQVASSCSAHSMGGPAGLGAARAPLAASMVRADYFDESR